MTDTKPHAATITVEWGPGASDIPEGVIHATIGNALDALMAQLVCMGVTDPTIDSEGIHHIHAGAATEEPE